MTNTNKDWREDFRDFYYELNLYAGRKLGIEGYIEFIEKVEQEAYDEGYENGFGDGFQHQEITKIKEGK